ncbi:MAG: aminopeptidase [Lentisphaeria bacterium]|nr:aminopeptidase [Lentisphaeria bacterium]
MSPARRTARKGPETPKPWVRENAWPRIPKRERAAMEAYCHGYMAFLSTAKTEREAFDAALAEARRTGFVDLADRARTTAPLRPGDRVLRGCQGKTLFAAVIGKRSLEEGLCIVGGHTDVPRLDAKPCPLYQDSELALFDTHYYGGIKKYQWVALPLAVHGIVVRRDGSTAPVVLGEDPRDPVFVITDLLPHLGKDQAAKTLAEGITGENLNVLVGSWPVDKRAGNRDAKEKVKANILTLLHQRYGMAEEDFASADLEFVPAGPAREVGFDRSMILGYGHDDRVCAYAALRALLDLDEPPEHTAVVLLCDKEEIGSVGATGMDSTFFENSVAEMVALEGQSGSTADLALRRCLERSCMLSADVNVLHDPNYPEVSSPNNTARMNAGVVLAKYTGSRGKSHSSEARAEFMAEVRQVFDEAGVIWQVGELGKVDAGGGGTIAMFLARYGMDVVDCGVGLLSMHAPWEVAGKLDTYMAYKAYRAFLRHARPGTAPANPG